MMKKSKIHYILFPLLVLAGCFLTSFSSAQTTNNKGPINPYEIKGFIAQEEASADELMKEREKWQKKYEENDKKYWAKKAEFVAALGMQELGDDFQATKNLISSNASALKNLFTGEFSAAGDAALNSVKITWDRFTSHLGDSWNPIIKPAFTEEKGETARKLLDMVYEKYPKNTQLAKIAEEMIAIGDDTRNAQVMMNSYDEISPNQKVYKYVTEQGETIYFIKKDQSYLSKGMGAVGLGSNDEYQTVVGNTKGCIPLPAKLAENQSCIFCPMFLTIFNAAQTMATNSYAVLATSISYVMILGFAIYIAFLVLKYVSAFTKQDAPKFTNEIFIQAFKVMFAYILLSNASYIYNLAVGPILSAGMEFGSAVLFENGSGYVEWCSNELNLNTQAGKMNINDGVLPPYLYVKLDCFIRSVQAEIATAQSIGSTLMCVARNAGASSINLVVTKIENAIWDFSMFFQGLIIWGFSLLIALAFAFYLIDATVRVGILGALMPFLIACWPFKMTSGYTKQGWTMFLNTFFTYAMMGLVVSVNIQLILMSLTGGKGGGSALQKAIDGNDIRVLQALLDIGFSGFLVLLACCLFGFKLIAQAAALASTFAGGGGDAKIGSSLGTLAYSGAAGLAVGTKKGEVGGVVGLAGKAMGAVGRRTGITAALNKGKDKVTGGIGRALGLGKFGGKAAKSNSQAQQQNQQSGANQQQNQQFGNNRQNQQQQNQQIGDNPQNQQQQSNNGQGQGQNQGQGQGQGQNRQTGNNGQQASPGSAGPRINPNEAPEVTAAMREAERNLHDFAAHSQELQKAKEKTLKAEQAAKQAQAEAVAARQQATAARGTPQAARFEQMAQAAEAKVQAVNKAYVQAQQNEQQLQQTVNNDAVNTYVNQRRAISARNGKIFNEEATRNAATTRVGEIKDKLNVLLSVDPRYN